MKEFSIHFKNMKEVSGKIRFIMIFEFKTFFYNILFFFYLKEYLKLIVLFLIFIICYYLNINFYEWIGNNFNDLITNVYIYIFFNFVKEYIIIILLLLLILFILFIFWIKKFNIKETIKFILIFSYHRINFIVNLLILEKILNINMQEFFEYNFIIMLIFIIYMIIFWIYFIIKKKPLNYKLLHFLNVPVISILFWFLLFIINDMYFFKYKHVLIDFDLKYYETNIEVTLE